MMIYGHLMPKQENIYMGLLKMISSIFWAHQLQHPPQ